MNPSTQSPRLEALLHWWERRRPQLVILLGLLGALLLVALRVTRHATLAGMLTDKLLLVFPLLAGVLILLHWPQIGMPLWIVAALLVPIELGTGTKTSLNAAVLGMVGLLGLWVYQGVTERRGGLDLPRRVVLPLLGLAATAALALIVGQLPWFLTAHTASLSAQMGGLFVFVLAAGAFLLGATRLRERRVLAWTVGLFILIGAAQVFWELILRFNPSQQVLVLDGVYNHSLFWTWLMALTFSQALINRSLPRLTRAGLWLIVVALLLHNLGLNSAWTSGWLPGMAAAAVILVLSGSRLAWTALALGLVGVAARAQQVRSLLLVGDNEYSLNTRLEAWRLIAEIVARNPLLGLGPANYYWYTPMFAIRGYAVVFNSHNNYVDLIAQVGIIGLGFFLWFAWKLGWLGWGARTRVTDDFQRAFLIGALGGLAGSLVAMMLGDWLLPFIYNIGFKGLRASLIAWVFLGALAGVAHAARQPAAEDAL
jgi:O-antigen ligase